MPYVFPAPELVDCWRPVFADPDILHVGLNWIAEIGVRWGPARSVPLEELSRLFSLPLVKCYSLQPGAELAAYPQVRDLGHEGSPDARFCQTAAILANLDLLVACDSSVTHLAGAMAVPCWTLIGLPCDAQWGTNRSGRAPFYPHHRKYVQAEPGIWEDIIWEVRADLKELSRQKLSRSS